MARGLDITRMESPGRIYVFVALVSSIVLVRIRYF